MGERSRIKGDFYVRICGSRGLRCPRPPDQAELRVPRRWIQAKSEPVARTALVQLGPPFARGLLPAGYRGANLDQAPTRRGLYLKRARRSPGTRGHTRSSCRTGSGSPTQSRPFRRRRCRWVGTKGPHLHPGRTGGHGAKPTGHAPRSARRPGGGPRSRTGPTGTTPCGRTRPRCYAQRKGRCRVWRGPAERGRPEKHFPGQRRKRGTTTVSKWGRVTSSWRRAGGARGNAPREPSKAPSVWRSPR